MGNTGLSQQRRQPSNMSMFSLVSVNKHLCLMLGSSALALGFNKEDTC